jgi:predicted AlkP superfamily pyrophosphatase or phosphodiesterase
MVTASLGFIGSKQKINGMQNSYYYEYGKPRIGMTERVEIIKKWLSLPEKVRPHFIAVYNNETDHAGHGFGPDSKETEEAVGEIDSFIAQLQVAIEESGLPVNVVFVSDHGMTSIKQDHPIKTPSSIDTAKYVVVDHRALLSVHAKEREDIMPLYNKLKAEKSPYYTVFLQKDLPKELHFDMKEDKYNRIGDIILLAKWPGLFSKSPKGSHGFNPYEIKDMHATFYAWGPAFKKNLTIESFPTVDLYDMVMKALRLKPETNDGTGALAEQVLK